MSAARQGVSLNRPLLAKVLGMMGSNGDGEALEAARHATRMIVDAGMTWSDILGAPQASNTTQPAVEPDPPVYVAGKALRPPHGVRWLDTILFLLEDAKRNDRYSEDARWLGVLPARLAQRQITSPEAIRLIQAHRALTHRPQPWTPR